MESDPRSLIIKAAPYSDESQGLVAQLLREDPSCPGTTDAGFTDLLDDLRAKGQLDAGVVSRDGVLFNGNTRAVALRDLSHEYIRVAVLPPNASAEDFDVLELTLQVQKDLKRDYSFANELLMIEEQVQKYGKAIEDVAKLLNRRPKTVKQLLWILQEIRELQAKSTSSAGSGSISLPLSFFNDHQGKLEELYRTYESMRKKDPIGAERMRVARLMGVVLGKSKTDLRFVDESFYGAQIVPRLPDIPPPPSEPKGVGVIPGTSIKVSKETDAQESQAREVLTSALRAAAIVQAGPDAPVTEIEKSKNTLANLNRAYDPGLTAAGRQDRILKRAVEPIAKLEDAAEALEACRMALLKMTPDEAPDWEDFDEKCARLRKALDAVASILERRGVLSSALLPTLQQMTGHGDR